MSVISKIIQSRVLVFSEILKKLHKIYVYQIWNQYSIHYLKFILCLEKSLKEGQAGNEHFRTSMNIFSW